MEHVFKELFSSSIKVLARFSFELEAKFGSI